MTGSLRVLQVHNRYRLAGGEDAVVEAEKELLERAGHHVTRFERTNPEGGAASAIRLLTAPWNVSAATELSQMVRISRPTVAHVHNTWFSVSPSALATLKRLGLPTVMTVHNYRLACLNGQLLRKGSPCQLCVGSHPWKGVRYRCYRDSLPASTLAATTLSLNRYLRTWDQKVDIFVVLTEFMREILERTGILNDRMVLVPNFVSDPGPRLAEPSKSDMVLFLGRLAPEKGARLAVDAWRRSAPSGLRLVVAGDGPLRGELESMNVPRVSFAGALSAHEVRRLMLAARALVFPSTWYEGQPLVLLEAQAAGLPVFASALGGIGETVAGAGKMIESWLDFSFDSLNDFDLDSLGAAGRRQWQSRFTPERHLEALLGVYRSADSRQKSSS